jgi:hypothetical protein
MFSTRFKNKYKITVEYASEAEHVESIEVTEAQAAFLKKLIDGSPVPKGLEQVVFGTPFELDTLRDAVR